MISDSLTTEHLRKKFKNNFNLCNFAISIGRSTVLSGVQTNLAEILENVQERATEEHKK